MNRKPAYEIVLNALKAGKEITIDDQVFVMEDNKVYILIKGIDTDTKEIVEKLINPGIPLNWFLSACEKMSDDDLFVIACETALMEMAQEKSRKRGIKNDCETK